MSIYHTPSHEGFPQASVFNGMQATIMPKTDQEYAFSLEFAPPQMKELALLRQAFEIKKQQADFLLVFSVQDGAITMKSVLFKDDGHQVHAAGVFAASAIIVLTILAAFYSPLAWEECLEGEEVALDIHIDGHCGHVRSVAFLNDGVRQVSPPQPFDAIACAEILLADRKGDR